MLNGTLLTVDREIAGALSTSTRRFIHRSVYIFDPCHPFSSAIALVAIERRDESYVRIDHRRDTTQAHQTRRHETQERMRGTKGMTGKKRNRPSMFPNRRYFGDRARPRCEKRKARRVRQREMQLRDANDEGAGKNKCRNAAGTFWSEIDRRSPTVVIRHSRSTNRHSPIIVSNVEANDLPRIEWSGVAREGEDRERERRRNVCCTVSRAFYF